MVVTTDPAGSGTYPNFPTTEDDEHPAKEWVWKVTALVQDSVTGRRYETLPVTVTRMFNGTDPDAPSPEAIPIPTDIFALYPDMAINLRRDTTAGSLNKPAVW